MGARDSGYYGPSSDDLGRGAGLLLVFTLLGIAVVVALCAMSLRDMDADGGVTGGSTSLAVDVDDQWAMHRAGLPTKADVLAWHMYGRWAFYEIVDDVQEVHIWHDLPGGAGVWDALYGLDPDCAAFKFKGGGLSGDED